MLKIFLCDDVDWILAENRTHALQLYGDYLSDPYFVPSETTVEQMSSEQLAELTYHTDADWYDPEAQCSFLEELGRRYYENELEEGLFATSEV
jgi:hypothetical protein